VFASRDPADRAPNSPAEIRRFGERKAGQRTGQPPLAENTKAYFRNFSLKGSAATFLKVLMTLNWPVGRVSPMNTLLIR
jgi:hypothetical protein